MTDDRKKIIVLDRDGVINRELGHAVTRVEEFEFLPGVLEAIARITERGYPIYIASNQSAVGRGIMTEDALMDITRTMLAAINEHNGRIAGVIYCCHGPEEGCSCRKPKPGLLQEIAELAKTRTDNLVMVGDSHRDLEAAREAGAVPVLVLTGNGKRLADGGLPEGLCRCTDLLAFSYLV